MDTVILELHLPATLYPTLEVLADDWERARLLADAGQRAELTGALAGWGCRGGLLGGGLGRVTLTGPAEDPEHEFYPAEYSKWGKIHVSAQT